MNANRVAHRLALAAGLMDGATGLGLLALPGWTLARMGVPVPGPEAILFVRFTGVFVWAVGMSYLWGECRPAERRRVVLGVTIWFRLGAGLFTGVAVATGAFARGWLAVTVTDLGFVVAQLWLLARGVGRDE
ncbi:MAG: hypothetical protein ACHQ4G_09625 [Opitutales bacterium]